MTDLHAANGVRFIASSDMIVRWCRAERREFEPETCAWMFGVMAARGGWFVDVGASTGWFAIPMALRGYDVVAFEANPAVAHRLRENARLNGARFRVDERAISDGCRVATFWFNPGVPLTSGGSIERATCAKPSQRKVATVPLDVALYGTADRVPADAPPVSLVKIDVEGHELAVLRGASRTIAKHRPHLVLEANTDAARDALAAWLEAERYDWERADGRNLLCSPRS